MADPLIARTHYWDGDPRVAALIVGAEKPVDVLVFGTSRSVDDSGGLFHHLEDLDKDWLGGKGNESMKIDIANSWTSTLYRAEGGGDANQAIAGTGLDIEDVVFGQAVVAVTDGGGPHTTPNSSNTSRYLATTGSASWATNMLARAKAQVALGNNPVASRIVYKQAAADSGANHETRSSVGGTATAYGSAYHATGEWVRWDDEVDATQFDAGNSCQVHGKFENNSSIAGGKTSIHDGATWMRFGDGAIFHPMAVGSRTIDDLINRHPAALYNGSLPLRKEPDGEQVVLIEIGTNDTGMSVADYKADALTLVGMIRTAIPNVPIVFMSMYDANGWSGSPSFRQAYQELVSQLPDTLHLDMYARQPSYADGDADGDYGDGTHYVDAGRIKLMTNFAEVLEDAAAVANGAHYEIYHRPTVEGADTLVGMVGPTILTYTVAGLAADSVGHYWIESVTACGVGNDQAVARRLRKAALDGSADLIAPAPRATYGLKLVLGAGGQVTAHWRYQGAGAEADAGQFFVYVAEGVAAFDYDTPTHTVSSVRVSSSQDLGSFADGTTVRCVVRSATEAGVAETNTVEATAVADAVAPVAPVTIVAEVVSV